MDVVGHDDPGNLGHADSVKMLQCFANDCRMRVISEDTRSVARIEPAFHRSAESCVVLPLGVR